MNKEIEEILNYIDQFVYVDQTYNDIKLSKIDCKLLLSYIEQLKQESKNNKETYGDMLYELEKENKELKKRNKEIYEGFMATQEELTEYATKNEQLENNRDKAIEILGNYKHYSTPTEEQNSENEDIVDNAYNILKGDSDDTR
ncbi:MAG: hypothetical protein IJ568_05440 [Bacilli bacterium]|nr:hypothetical protein [Bacilli bacterium]